MRRGSTLRAVRAYLADRCTVQAAERPLDTAPPGWSTLERPPGRAGSPAGNPSVPQRRALRAAGSAPGTRPSRPSRRQRRGTATCGRPCDSSSRSGGCRSSPARSTSSLHAKGNRNSEVQEASVRHGGQLASQSQRCVGSMASLGLLAWRHLPTRHQQIRLAHRLCIRYLLRRWRNSESAARRHKALSRLRRTRLVSNDWNRVTPAPAMPMM